MKTSYALTLAGVSLRMEIPLLIIAGVDAEISYRIAAWSCWLGNLMILYFWLKYVKKERLDK